MIPFDTLFVYSMAAIVVAIFYRGVCEFVIPAISNYRECARCGSMLDARGFCERCNK